MKHGSLFSGIGGFDLAFERAGFETLWQCEIDARAGAVLAYHWPDVLRFEDVQWVHGAQIDPVDVITFGSPCQDLSVAGRRAGLDGERSGLFFEATRIIREMREATDGRYPTFTLWENVPGAFSSNLGRDFGAVLDSLAALGALDIAWRVLDAQNFGVAQRRRRVFLVADFGGSRAGEVLFEPEGVCGDPAEGGAPGQDVAGAITASAGHHGHSSPRGDGGDNLIVAPFDERNVTSAANRSRVEFGAPSPTLHAGGMSIVAKPPAGDEIRDLVSRSNRVRRLTPLECERLQGFPDGWTDNGQADSHRYRQLGNAVAVPVAEWVANRIKEAMQ